MKKRRPMILLTFFLDICPILAGILLWDRLPDLMATHFGMGNVPNGWSSRAFTVFGIPLILLGIHGLCIAATLFDPKRENISDKLFACILWIVPACSLICMTQIYGYALGWKTDAGMWVQLLVGVLLLLIGNYLPKCAQNYTVGIKLPWTLDSEENWNRTHRLAGWLLSVSGILFLVNAFFQKIWILGAAAGMILVPVIYSAWLYRKGI